MLIHLSTDRVLPDFRCCEQSSCVYECINSSSRLQFLGADTKSGTAVTHIVTYSIFSFLWNYNDEIILYSHQQCPEFEFPHMLANTYFS